ncbi:MAG TPA: hypothetical protein VLD18_15320, partial [Verrucomicrobiae bacterium]|nr:hypothetical protein [Verrucomicrobiae bacterium]
MVTPPAPPDWWGAGWAYRLPLVVGAAGFDRSNHGVDVPVDFTALLAAVGLASEVDVSALRLVEVDAFGGGLNEAVPFQFDPAPGFHPVTAAQGTLVLQLTGVTPAAAERRYHLYFSPPGTGAVPPVVAPQVVVTDNVVDEGQSSLRFETVTGTLYYHKQGAGFSSWVDAGGNDWLGYKPTGGSAGNYRGIPNMVYPEGHFHPGATSSTSTLRSAGPLKATIHSITTDGLWECQWEIYGRFARMTVLRANGNYWFLYEGTPGGLLEPATDLVVRSSGVTTAASAQWLGDLAGDEWVYFADPNVARSLYVALHQPDGASDSYRPMNGEMTVFGFGRNLSTGKFLTGTPKQFTIGLVDATAVNSVSPLIYSAYRDVTVQLAALQLAPSGPDETSPTVPAGLVAGGVSSGSMGLSWSAATDNVGVAGYRVYRDGLAVGTTTELVYVDEGLAVATAYSYEVTAYDAADNESARSAPVVGATQATLTVNLAGNGQVNAVPGAASYELGTEVTLTAEPDLGWLFAGWSGDAAGAANPL